MNLQLTKPELEDYVQQQVSEGRFPTPEAVVEDALVRAMQDEAELTDEDVAVIKTSIAELDRGEGISSEEVARRMRQMYGSRNP